MNAVVYVRVSTEEQTHGTSLDSQTDACIAYAKKNGIDLLEENIFREAGVSGRLADRPELVRMLDYCAKNKGQITHCIIWKVDRLSRSTEVHSFIKVQLSKSGVKLASVTEPIDDTPSGNLMETMLAGFAQFDNQIRAARTTGGMKARLLQGGWPHAVPYGYSRSRTASGIVSIAPGIDAPKIKKFLEEFASGTYTVQQARQLAFDLGIRNKQNKLRTWQIVKECIANPIYAGLITSNYIPDQVIKGLHVPLISESTYYRNQGLLSGKMTNYSRQAEEDWPLRGGFLKHICGKPVTGSSPKGNSGPSPRYACPQCRQSILKAKVSSGRDIVHRDFIKLLEEITPSEHVQKLFKAIVLKEWNNALKNTLKHSRALEKELEALEDRKSRIIDLLIENSITIEQKNQKLGEVENEINIIKLKQHDAKGDINDKEQIIDGSLLFMSNIGKFWNLAPLGVKKRIQDTVFPDGLSYDFENGFGTFRLSDSYLLIKEIADKSAKNNDLVAPTRIELVTSGL